MHSLNRDLQIIIQRCKRAEGVLLLFDFDGTLSAIARCPSGARMFRGWRERLAQLNGCKNIIVGIITGRALDDIRRRVRIPGIIYAASHGFEISRGSRMLLSHGREHHRHLARLAHTLRKAMEPVAGAEVEYKKTAVAVHYRRVKQSQIVFVKRRVEAVARPLLHVHDWTITAGKKVVEVRPANQWNKGNATQWIIKQVAPRYIPCYIGDDITDEDAFRAIGKKGITVRVGMKRSSCARYYVKHVDELIPWMEEMTSP